MNHMEIPFVAGLSVTGSEARTPRRMRNDIKAARRKTQATVERTWVEQCRRC